MERPKREEFVNGLTHAIGTLLSLFAAAYLLIAVWPQSNMQKTAASFLYGFSLIAVYFSSMMSHWEPNPDRKIYYRRLDQAFIYILIVASFTPFSVEYLHEFYYWLLLILMWAIAIVGFVSKLWAAHRVQAVAIWIYLALGWMSSLAFLPWLLGFGFKSRMPLGAIGMIFLGGVFYSFGTLFLYLDRRAWYFHAIWHVFVMLGSISHFSGILVYFV